MALTAGTKLTPQIEEIISKHIKTQLRQILEHHKSQHTPKSKTSVHQEWMFVAPKTRQHNGKTFTWCTKCHQGRGQWVSDHDSSTHIDGFHPQPRHFQQNRQKCNGILKTNGSKDNNSSNLTNQNGKTWVSFADMYQQADSDNDQLSAQLSLWEGIMSCFDFPDPDGD